jgi:hypothetical protein
MIAQMLYGDSAWRKMEIHGCGCGLMGSGLRAVAEDQNCQCSRFLCLHRRHSSPNGLAQGKKEEEKNVQPGEIPDF